MGLPIILFTVVIQPIFSNTGTTVLFYINDKAVTLEAYLYGIVMGVLFVTVIQWIGCSRVFIDSEKLYYLFGKIGQKNVSFILFEKVRNSIDYCFAYNVVYSILHNCDGKGKCILYACCSISTKYDMDMECMFYNRCYWFIACLV